MPSIRRWWRSNFLIAEATAALVAWIGLVVWAELMHGLHHVDALLNGVRAALYGALATIDATLLGFIIATAAIVLSLAQSERFEVLRASAPYKTLWQVFTSTIRVLAVGTLISLAGLFADKDPHQTSSIAMLACALLAFLVVVRMARSIWAFEQVIAIATTSPSH